MKAKFIDQEMKYTGEQLHSLYAYLNTGLLGDSMVAWIGGCNVSFDKMVDGEDLRAQARIQGGKMLHFIVEKFHASLYAGVVTQRLLASMVHDLLVEWSEGEEKSKFRRVGDDIFYQGGKLSISIATVSPVSTLIHFAMNCTNEGTPDEVETAALDEIDIEPRAFAEEIMQRFCDEMISMDQATCKVKWVK